MATPAPVPLPMVPFSNSVPLEFAATVPAIVGSMMTCDAALASKLNKMAESPLMDSAPSTSKVWPLPTCQYCG